MKYWINMPFSQVKKVVETQKYVLLECMSFLYGSIFTEPQKQEENVQGGDSVIYTI